MPGRLRLPDQTWRRWRPAVVVFAAAFAVSAAASGGDSQRVIRSGAVEEPVSDTRVAREISAVEPLPELAREPRRRPRAPRPAQRPAPRPLTGFSEPSVAASVEPPATSPRTSSSPPPSRTPQRAVPPPPPPTATAPPVAAPRPAPPASAPTPNAPAPEFDSSGSFDSSG